ncbi:hypothetical protein, partial [Pseudomonas caricapapayae]|uniref:hypothetical protein n=1 Tax=Pseudomonas caricapapayae TaxID=46678 RepID=UPI001C813207
LIYKAFSFPSAPEVGRIIDRSQRASTVNFKNIEIARFVIIYIEQRSKAAQYIAQTLIIPHHA